MFEPQGDRPVSWRRRAVYCGITLVLGLVGVVLGLVIGHPQPGVAALSGAVALTAAVFLLVTLQQKG